MQCRSTPAATHPTFGLHIADRTDAQPYNHSHPYTGVYTDKNTHMDHHTSSHFPTHPYPHT
jgi:hypothetical protein